MATSPEELASSKAILEGVKQNLQYLKAARAEGRVVTKLDNLDKYTGSKYDLEVMAICSDTSLSKMKRAIRNKKMEWVNVNGPRTLTGDFHKQYDIVQTPVLYLLNENKKIIAKCFPADQLERILIQDIRRDTKQK